MNIEWSSEKEKWLEIHRNLSFEMVVNKIVDDDLIDNIQHPNEKKYPGKFIFVIAVDSYCYVVPYVKTDTGVFLKTIIPSRKMTKYYLGDKNGR